MNTVEDRVRAALTAHATDFTASPDAWQRVQAKGSRRSRSRAQVTWLARHTQLVIPAAAAATVIAVALGATMLAHGFSGRGSVHGGATSSTPRPSPSGQPLLLPTMERTDRPVSAVISLPASSTTRTWFWIGTQSAQYWYPTTTAARLQLCHIVHGETGGSGFCWPEPLLTPAHPAFLVSNDMFLGDRYPVITGAVEPGVTSVTAVLPDGQRCAGTVGGGRGFPEQAWTVTCPAPRSPTTAWKWATGTQLEFADASGHVVARLAATASLRPASAYVPRPANGGVTMFRFSGDHGGPGGSLTAYLVDGHVGFYAPTLYPDGAFSPATVSGPPAGGGLPVVAGLTSNDQNKLVKAFGYAHGNVATVVITLPGGGHVTATTFAAWPGSDVRLWQVSIPASAWPAGAAEPRFPATADNTAGQVVGRFQLGDFPS